jgi:hypothetical protein
MNKKTNLGILAFFIKPRESPCYVAYWAMTLMLVEAAPTEAVSCTKDP